jgi:hypothetical protein
MKRKYKQAWLQHQSKEEKENSANTASDLRTSA